MLLKLKIGNKFKYEINKNDFKSKYGLCFNGKPIYDVVSEGKLLGLYICQERTTTLFLIMLYIVLCLMF